MSGLGRRLETEMRTAGRDVVQLVRKLFPDGIVELAADFDEVDIEAASAAIRKQLIGIEGADLLYEGRGRTRMRKSRFSEEQIIKILNETGARSWPTSAGVTGSWATSALPARARR